MTGERDRFLAYATVVTLAVGALSGTLAMMTVLKPIDWSASTVEARVATLFVVGSLLAVVLLYVALPVGLAVFRAREDRRWLLHGAVAVGAIFGPPLAFVGSFYVILERLPTDEPGAFLLVILLTSVLAIGLAALSRSARLPGAIDWDHSTWPVALNLALVIVFGLGFVGSMPFAAGFAAEHTDEYGGYAGPHASFDIEERSAGNGTMVLEFTHEGGDPLRADRLYVRGDGFADVDDVDQTEPGRWRGTVSGERPRRGGRAVVRGDSVTVGATTNCTIIVRYEGATQSRGIAGHRCGAPIRDR